jgi:hypothetical protein
MDRTEAAFAPEVLRERLVVLALAISHRKRRQGPLIILI